MQKNVSFLANVFFFLLPKYFFTQIHLCRPVNVTKIVKNKK